MLPTVTVLTTQIEQSTLSDVAQCDYTNNIDRTIYTEWCCPLWLLMTQIEQSTLSDVAQCDY